MREFGPRCSAAGSRCGGGRSPRADTRKVRAVVRSRTNTSDPRPLTSRLTRFEAFDVKATYRPPAEMAAWLLPPLAWFSWPLIENRSVRLVDRFRTNTSAQWLVSPATRFDASDEKATDVPSDELRAS